MRYAHGTMARSVTWVSCCCLFVALALLALSGAVGCSGDDGGAGEGGGGSIGWGGHDVGGAAGAGGEAIGGQGTGGYGGALCPTTFRFEPTISLHEPRIAGEWHDFDISGATALEDPDDDGVFEATIDLPPGLHAYKIVYEADQSTHWVLDPSQPRRKYVEGIENSGMAVRDCNLPTVEVEQSTPTRAAAGQGRYRATLAFVDAADGSGPDPTGFSAELVQDGVVRPLTGAELAVATDGTATVDVDGLADGKYRVLVRAATQSGRRGDPVRLVFWIEQERFSWQDALIYMVMTDRYRDGDPSNNPPPTPDADPRGDWHGGDLEGLRQAIAEGKLDQLGVRAIWLTPLQTNPTDAFMAADGVHYVTGYHGYWPVAAREVDPRLGGADALRALVAEAHAHGIRVLQDFVVNHVHVEHEYVAAHPDWFRTGCVCGTADCGWTEHALDCMFRTYMPDIDHTVPEANQQFVEDAVWWLDEFDLDGLRIDAVKHVEEIATRNLAAEVRDTFEPAGTRYFLMGETAMGWQDCADPCNDDNYGTIARYIGPHGLDGQFDFVLFHAVSKPTFAYGDKGMIHADYWFQHGQSKWPEGAIMTPYVGSHDEPRFVTLADYRDLGGAHDRGIAYHQWNDTAEAPADGEPYRRLRIGMSWLLTLPGAPLLYYGDEYGQWGGADPNNRMMHDDQVPSGSEQEATLLHVRALGQARQRLRALRRGDYLSLGATEDTLTFARRASGGDVAVVGLTRATAAEQVTVDVSGLGWSSGTTLHDEMGGPNVTVAGDQTATFTIAPSGVVILAP